MKRTGFTLIELLIVVAIIAILAAIAIPNFLQAQTRAKVSRAQADMRSLGTGLESYFVDWNDYPPDWSHGVGAGPYRHFQRLLPITTPIAYTTSLPVDPFARAEENAGVQNTYVYAAKHLSGHDNIAFEYEQWKLVAFQLNIPDQYHNLFWYLRSVGPDGNPVTLGSGDINNAEVMLYDPTNGTISPGELVRTNMGIMN